MRISDIVTEQRQQFLFDIDEKKYTVEETIPELTIAEHNITNNLHGSISDSFDSTVEFAK